MQNVCYDKYFEHFVYIYFYAHIVDFRELRISQD